MHSVLEGVIKNLFNYWFNGKISASYSLGKYMQELDRRLLNIKPPKYIPCTPRSIYTHHLWRAHEYSTFILFYSLTVFHGLMSHDCYENLKKLVIFLEVLLSPAIDLDNLKKVDNLIQDFVSELNELYDEKIMLSGTHELLHLVDCTIAFGPLNLINLFQFEELNRILVSFLHGFDLIGEEIFKIFLTARTLLNYSENINNVQIKNYILKNLKFKSSNKKRLFHNLACVKMLSKAEVTTNQLYLDLMKNNQMNEQTTLTMYSKIIFNGVYFSSKFLHTKRCDSCFVSSNGTYGLIEKFFYNNEIVYVIARKIVMIYNPFFTQKYPELKSKLSICAVSNDYFIEEVRKIQKSFIIKPDDDSCYISTFTTGHLFN
jgi:hypothetical protein